MVCQGGPTKEYFPDFNPALIRVTTKNNRPALNRPGVCSHRFYAFINGQPAKRALHCGNSAANASTNKKHPTAAKRRQLFSG